jgi:hypothetical protein
MSTSTQLHEILYIDSQYILILLFALLRANITAVQIGAPDPECMDTPRMAPWFSVSKELSP